MIEVPRSLVDWRSKGFWLPDTSRDAAEIAARRPSLFGGEFTWPVLVLRQSAAEANIATMAAYCRRHDLDFAPHAKTTMAPGLLAAQFRAGAWGMTVATANQALVLRRLGVERVVIANQVLDPAALRWLARECAAGWEVYFQVDSVAGVRAADAAAEESEGRLRVFVELGHAGGRTGVRTAGDLQTVARAAGAAARLELVGLTTYEGQLVDQAAVDELLDRLVAGMAGLAAEQLLPERPLVSAGGSVWFDRVAERLSTDQAAGRLSTDQEPVRRPADRVGDRLPPGVRVILRSGASVTHDDGFYRERTPFLRVPEEGPLSAALEIWAQVLSVPEPGLAIAGMGKRDVPFDEGLPVPMEVRRADGTTTVASGLRVTKLNDHHTYLEGVLEVGDLVRFGISHPCTAFDKWRDIPVVDDEHRVVDVLHTYF